MLKKLTLIVIALLPTVVGLAQNDVLELDDKNKRQLKALGKEAERNGNYYIALDYYKKLVEIDTIKNNLKNRMRLADMLRITRDYKFAEEQYAYITDSADTEFPLATYYLGMMQKANGKHDTAIVTFTRFKKLSRNVEDRKFKRLYKIELEGCYLATSLKDSTDNAVIANLGTDVNNPHIDFSPVPVTDNKIVFGSLKEKEKTYYEVENEDSVIAFPTRKFYVAEKQGDNWKFQGEWEGPFNSDDEDIANGSFSIDKKRFYFSKCAQNWQFKIICKIYYSEKVNGEWQEPQLMNELVNLEGYTSSHPTVGREPKKNQEAIYFVSDRERSKGGTDIWYTVYDKRKKTWKKPKTCGSKINTIGDEVTPFYDLKTKTLYYSTTGKPSIGGFDVYSAVGQTNKWEKHKHLGMPINSTANDLDFALKPSARGGFIISNREGGQSMYNPTCCYDIYDFTYSKFIEHKLFGEIFDQETGAKLTSGNAEVELYIVDGEEKLLAEIIPVKDGNYDLHLRPGMNYRVEVKREGYFTGHVDFSTENMSKSDSSKQDISLELIPPEPIIIPKINYNFDSDKLTEDSKTTLDTTLVILLTENPGFKIEIRAHTDSKGSEAYNNRLSQKRAESVVRYLVAKGIHNNRLIAKGYGESLPIAPNRNEDGSDNPEGRQRNRRTEFKIIGNFDPDLIEYDEEDVVTRKRKKG